MRAPTSPPPVAGPAWGLHLPPPSHRVPPAPFLTWVPMALTNRSQTPPWDGWQGPHAEGLVGGGRPQQGLLLCAQQRLLLQRGQWGPHPSHTCLSATMMSPGQGRTWESEEAPGTWGPHEASSQPLFPRQVPAQGRRSHLNGKEPQKLGQSSPYQGLSRGHHSPLTPLRNLLCDMEAQRVSGLPGAQLALG